MKKILSKICMYIIMIAAIIYIAFSLISQQRLINTYNKEIDAQKNELQQAKEEQKELNEIIQNQNSIDYIEDVARDKLDMYLPNERVYVDSNK